MRPTIRAAAALAATLAACAAAPAAVPAAETHRIVVPHMPVSEGVIEHRVQEICTKATGIYERFNHNGCMTATSWVASDRDRDLFRAADGTIVGESATVDGTIFSWTSRTNTLNVAKGRATRASNLSREGDGWLVRETVARGWYAPVREEDRGGRAVVVLTEQPASPEDNAEMTLVVDKATYQPLERSFRSRDGGLEVKERLLSDEDLPRAGNERLLQMSDRPGVRVKEVQGDDEVVASAARRAGLKAKTRAKIRRKARAPRKARG